jgi:hypothetical protein
MGHLRYTLTCLAAVAFLGAAAAGASAEAPEFGRCVRQAGGKYADRGCTETTAGRESYEWEPGPGPKARFTEALSGGKAFRWKLATNEEGFCSGETATGEYSGPKAVGHVNIVLSGCTFTGPSGNCGTVALEPLAGEIGVYTVGETAKRDKLGLKLTPEAGELLAEFECAAGVNPYIWHGGSIIVPLKTNRMLSQELLKYKQRHPPGYNEEQEPASFVGETPSPLQATSNFRVGGEKVFAPMGWGMSTELTNEEGLEANSVL